MKKLISVIAAVLLVLSLCACAGTPAGHPSAPQDTNPSVPTETKPADTKPQQTDPADTEPLATDPNEVTELGEGAVTFTFTAVLPGDETQTYTIHTDAETVGAALLDLGLIDGENGEWGLYVKTVCGVTLDYETDGMWWGLYENGEMAAVGVDSLAVNEGSVVEFRAEAA